MKYIPILIFMLFAFACSKQEKTSNQNIDSIKITGDNSIQVQRIEIDTLNIPVVEETEYSFEGIYPKLRGFNKSKFQNEVNQEFIKNYEDYLKRTKKIGYLHAMVDFEILTNDENYVSVLQRAGYVVHEANGYSHDGYVVNIDIKNSKILRNEDLKLNEIDIKDYNQKLTRYFKENTSFWNPDGVPFVKTQNDLLKYDFGIQNGFIVLAEYADPGARAEQSVYIIPIKKFYDSNNKVEQSGNKKSGSDEPSTASSDAIETVKNWITALGKQDFSTAYYMMSPKARGSYSTFISTKAYGGITKTNIHSIEVVSSSGCNYEVMAIYDSYDPSNRDGKYTQKFSVANCDGSWEITSVKNISINYFK